MVLNFICPLCRIRAAVCLAQGKELLLFYKNESTASLGKTSLHGPGSTNFYDHSYVVLIHCNEMMPFKSRRISAPWFLPGKGELGEKPPTANASLLKIQTVIL